MRKIGVGLCGDNGHQLSGEMIINEGAYLVGVCNVFDDLKYSGVKKYDSLEEMLKDERIELVCVCSQKRSEQAKDIQMILSAKKHVYAEKPCVMEEKELDDLLLLAGEQGVILCEMAGSIYEAPYYKVKEIVEENLLGEIVQIFAQKSYPYCEWRPQDEKIDGGLILQNAVYGIRFAEHIANQTVESISALETNLGNPKVGDLHMACSLQMTLKNGGLASVIANYLNQPSTGIWGNEELRIFGTKGYLRTDIEGRYVHLYTETEHLRFETETKESLFKILLKSIAENTGLPISAEYLVHPTRMALRARNALVAGSGYSEIGLEKKQAKEETT